MVQGNEVAARSSLVLHPPEDALLGDRDCAPGKKKSKAFGRSLKTQMLELAPSAQTTYWKVIREQKRKMHQQERPTAIIPIIGT